MKVDMDWVPQTTESVIDELPPPIPPKISEVASSKALDLHQPSGSRVLMNNDSAPVLPPKPKYVQV